jgi:MYXO-CTERM domain-containing protein
MCSNRPSMNRLSLLVAAATAAGVASVSADARACSLVGPQPHIVDPALQASDQTPPTLPTPLPARVKRGDPPQQTGCGSQVSSCDDLGIIYITAQATDDMTAPAKIGYRLSLESGMLPPGLNLPPDAIEPGEPSDQLVLYWSDGADQPPFAFTIRIVAIDLAGNESPPQLLLIADEPSGHAACAVARGGVSRPWLAGIAALAGLLATRRRRRLR